MKTSDKKHRNEKESTEPESSGLMTRKEKKSSLLPEFNKHAFFYTQNKLIKIKAISKNE